MVGWTRVHCADLYGPGLIRDNTRTMQYNTWGWGGGGGGMGRVLTPFLYSVFMDKQRSCCRRILG